MKKLFVIALTGLVLGCATQPYEQQDVAAYTEADQQRDEAAERMPASQETGAQTGAQDTAKSSCEDSAKEKKK